MTVTTRSPGSVSSATSSSRTTSPTRKAVPTFETMSLLSAQAEVGISQEFAQRLDKAIQLTGLQEPDLVLEIAQAIADRMSQELLREWPGTWVPYVQASLVEKDGNVVIELGFGAYPRIGLTLN